MSLGGGGYGGGGTMVPQLDEVFNVATASCMISNHYLCNYNSRIDFFSCVLLAV